MYKQLRTQEPPIPTFHDANMRNHRKHNRTSSEAQPLVAEELPFAATAGSGVGSSASVVAAEKGSVYAGRTTRHERRISEGKLPRYDDLFANTAAVEPSLFSGDDDAPQMSRNSISRWMRRVSREWFNGAGARERTAE